MSVMQKTDPEYYLRYYRDVSDSYICLQLVYDTEGKPADCIILETNRAFERMTGLTGSHIKGTRVSKILPQINTYYANWLETFDRVSETAQPVNFDVHAKTSDKYFTFSVASETRNIVYLVFREASAGSCEMEKLNILHGSIIEYLKYSSADIDYSLVADDLLRISDARCVLINLYDHQAKRVVIKEISLENSALSKLYEILGYKLRGSSWYIDPFLQSLIEHNKYNLKKLDYDVFSKKMPSGIIKIIKDFFNIGDVYGIGLFNDSEIIGSLMLFMRKGRELSNGKFIELFSNQLSMLLLQKQTEESLRASEAKYKGVFENLKVGLINCRVVTDDAGRHLYYVIEDVNPEFERITKKKKEELTGSSIFDLHKSIPEFSASWSKIVENTLGGNGQTTFEKYFDRLDRWYLVVCYSPNKNYLTFLFYDITEQKKMEKRLISEKEKAEETSLIKSEFIANMSHELRTPLNVILGAIQLFDLYLKNEPYSNIKKISSHVRYMKQNCLRLLRLVNNLIDTTRVDTGFLPVQRKNCDIVAVLRGITLSVTEYVNLKKISLTFKSSVDKKIITCDVDMIERIMLNLISNAIKFNNPGGTIKVNVSEKGGWVVISVKDDGVGIPEDKLGVIFERYKQANRLLTREHEGSGIGLSLTKSMVQLLGGSIEAFSTAGRGSEFVIKLPSALADECLDISEAYIPHNSGIVERMNVEFSDIYL